MKYQVRISKYVFRQLGDIKGNVNPYGGEISLHFLKELENLDRLPWSFKSATSMYNYPFPINIRVIPLKHYNGIYCINDNQVVVSVLVSQYMSIKKIIKVIKSKINNY